MSGVISVRINGEPPTLTPLSLTTRTVALGTGELPWRIEADPIVVEAHGSRVRVEVFCGDQMACALRVTEQLIIQIGPHDRIATDESIVRIATDDDMPIITIAVGLFGGGDDGGKHDENDGGVVAAELLIAA